MSRKKQWEKDWWVLPARGFSAEGWPCDECLHLLAGCKDWLGYFSKEMKQNFLDWFAIVLAERMAAF